MSFTNTYKKLLEVNFYHHYFLDDGATAFDDSPSLKAEQLEKYRYQSFLEVVPSAKTQRKLNGLKIAARYNKAGMELWVNASETAPSSGIYQPNVAIAQDESLTFLLKVKDYLFENYSTVEANPDIPFYFSNKKPFTEVGSFQYIDLETTTNAIEDFTISETTYEALQESLSERETRGLFGVLQLEMAGDDTTGIDGNARNVLNNDGTLQGTAPIYKIQILNRSTIWNYINPVDNSLIHSSDPTELPLVKNGIVGYSFDSTERPSAQPHRIIFEKDGGGNIIKTISEIFIN